MIQTGILFRTRMTATISVFMLLFIMMIISTVVNAQSVHAAVKQFSTGSESACAVLSNTVKCWGNNEHGELGAGTTGGSSAIPIAIAVNKDAVAAGPTVCTSRLPIIGTCIASAPSTPAIAPSALANKQVEKVSVGVSHTCALANARVYCWGNNSKGQLGTGTTDNSNVPVAAAINAAVAAGPTVCTSRLPIIGTCIASAPSTPAKPASALRNKEIIDIAAGDQFTCALATDGTVSCWGEGSDGRLGTNSTADSSFPKPVYVQAGSALYGKKGIKLARQSANTMCVLATTDGSAQAGDPYCWGNGMGNGTIPSTRSSASSVRISKSACVGGTSTSTDSTYFDALQPVKYTGPVTFSTVDTDNYATAVGSDQGVYYWGMNGYLATTEKKTTCGGGAGGNGLDSTGSQCGGGKNHGSPGCAEMVTKTTVTTITYQRIGYLSPVRLTQSGLLNQKPVQTTSGQAIESLFCALSGGKEVYCDANGTSMNQGQTGSNYTQKCVTTTVLVIFTQTTCDPAPVGPQQVYANGWMATRTVNQIDTGNNYTCASAADETLACWGLNGKGQLGTGDTANRNIPSLVSL